eukprot:gb/GEZN01001225.1/.p1 GENE.gb/GEZN01001225.1/~~gb/GEZN01001225.1/.p1  ORF type:complete len:845 (+),score=113.42 gb/GEZN01001225.1/:30-2564(+)
MSASKPSKMLQMMGLRIEDLLNTCFTGGAGCITRQEHQVFWPLVLELKEGTQFLIATLEQLRNTLDKKPGTISAASLCSTIVFLCLNTSFKESNVKSFIKHYEKNKEAQAKAFPPIKDVMRVLMLLHDKKDMLGSMVIGCSTLHTKEGFEQLANTALYPAFDDSDIKSGDQCFLFRYLSLQANNPDVRKEILSHNLNKMLTLPQQMKKAPKVAQSSLLALLHMLQDFLSKGPVDAAFLKRALNTVQQFYLWPKPYGTAARKSLEALQMELLAPGHNMREKYTRVAEQIDQGQSLHYITEYASVRSVGLLSVMEGRDFKAKSPRSSGRKEPKIALPPVQQAMLIMSAMKHEQGVGLSDAEVLAFKALSPAGAATLYAKWYEFHEKVGKSGIQMARQGRVEMMNQLKALLPTLTAKTDLGEKPLEFPGEMDSIYTPPETERNHIVVATTLKYTHELHQEIKIMCIKYMPYPSTPAYEQYEQILKYYSNAKRTQKLVLPIVVAGGDRLLHNFVCAHMRVLQQDPNLLKGLDVRFFIVPLEENRLASFMARYDGWYNRHIFIPFRQHNFIVPMIRMDGPGPVEQKEETVLTLPGEFFRELVERYVGESRFRWHINVYQVECWLADRKQLQPEDEETEGPATEVPAVAESGEEETPDYNIPFIQSCEIGLNARAIAFAEEKQLNTRNIEEIQKHRDFTCMSPPLSVGFTKMDLSGREQKISVEMISEYETLLCSNLPSKDEKRTFPPDPTASWLELYAKVKNPSSKRNILATEPRQHVVALGVTTEKGGVFDVLVDRQVFRGIKKIKISRVYTVEGAKKSKIWNSAEHADKPQGSPLIFPVESFFPLDL